MKIKRFKFTGRFHADSAVQFIADLLGSPDVLGSLEIASSSSSPAPGSISVAACPATVLNMGFFDALEAEDLMGSNGYLRKCMPETYDNVEADNLVLDMLLNPDSENLAVFTQVGSG